MTPAFNVALSQVRVNVLGTTASSAYSGTFLILPLNKREIVTCGSNLLTTKKRHNKSSVLRNCDLGVRSDTLRQKLCSLIM